MGWQPKSDAERRVNKALETTHYTVIHEYPVGERLRLDFLAKELMLGVEVHGDQHYNPNAFFFEDAEARKAARKRDERKVQLCKELGITLVTLSQQEVKEAASPAALMNLIITRFTGEISAEENSGDGW